MPGYLANELRHPTIVTQADVSQNRLCWSAPQIDEALRTLLAKNPNAGSCTVRVPVRNGLPATVGDLVETASRLLTLQVFKQLSEVDTAAFVAATSSMEESARLSKSLRDKSDATDLMIAQQATESGDYNAARQAIQTVLTSPQASIESKFFATLVEEKNERLAAHDGSEFRADHASLMLETATKLRSLTRKGPGALKYYALVAGAAAKLYRLAKEDWGLYQNWKVRQVTGGVWWCAELRALRADVSCRLLRKYEPFVRLVQLSEKTPYQSALPLAFLRVLEGAATLLNRLEIEGVPDTAASIRTSVFEVCKLAAAIAAQFHQDGERARAVVSAAMLSRDRTAACVLWAQEEATKIPSAKDREWALARIAEQPESLANGAESEEPIPIAMEQQIYESMAAGWY